MCRRRCLHAEFVERAVDVDEVLRRAGVPAMFAFRDQDGNGLEIVEQSAATISRAPAGAE